MKEKLAALYALQQIDSGLDALKRAAALLDQGQAEHAAYTEAKAAHTEAESALAATTAAVHDLELEQKSVAEKKKQYETKLYSGKVTNPKELQAMQDEAEMLGRLGGTLEEKHTTLLNRRESEQKHAQETKKTLSAAVAAFKTKNDAYKEQIEKMQAQSRVLTKQRGPALKAVAPELLPQYNTLRAAKGGLAIVALQDGNACGGCKMGLGSALVSLVRLGSDIYYCDNCRRMLVIPEAK